MGGYCWWEHRLFELTGRWASGTGDPEIRVLFGEVSARHASFSLQWRDRLPAPGPGSTSPPSSWPRAGPMSDALTLLDGQADDLLRLGGLMEVVLPRLHSAYRAHLAQASPVSEGPVIEVLRQIAAAGDREMARPGPSPARPSAGERSGRSGRPMPQWAADVAGSAAPLNARLRLPPTKALLLGHLDAPGTMFLQPLRAEYDASCTN